MLSAGRSATTITVINGTAITPATSRVPITQPSGRQRANGAPRPDSPRAITDMADRRG